MRTQLTLVSLALGLAFTSHNSFAQQSYGSFTEALTNSSVDLSFRYRYEGVDQDGFDEEANANTVRSRVTATSGTVANWHAVVELDYVNELFNKNYNNTINGNTRFPVVADPSGADLNQSYLRYNSGTGTQLTVGRQRINHNDQRFVGGVAWRQNEQTFDGGRIVSKLGDNFKIDYSYAYRVNRIFGSEHPAGDLQGNLHMLNTLFTPSKQHKLSVFAYSLDFDDALALSTRTVGFDYHFKPKGWGVHLSYAKQQDHGDNPNDYSTDFFAIDANVKVSKVTLAAGYESLGSDNGRGFITPLATLHKFQGWADKFLGTPGTGIDDTWFKIAGKVKGVKLAAIYHQFDANEGGADYGDEINLLATYKIDKNYSLLVKYASYSADEFATDTDKAWVQLLAKY